MVDDTLLRGDFENSRIVKTNMSGQERYALAHMMAEGDKVPRATFVRTVLLAGMEALGWDEERQIKEYSEYRLRCLRTGADNLFESE